MKMILIFIMFYPDIHFMIKIIMEKMSVDDIIYDGDEDENEKKYNNNNKALVANLKLFFICLILLFL